MGLEWFMIPSKITQARMSAEAFRLSVYGTYKTNTLIYRICSFLGNQEDIIIDFVEIGCCNK
jgi:hypothetical protein